MQWRAAAAQAFGVWAATRVGLVLFTLLQGALTAGTKRLSLGTLASAWVQWDAKWYLEIARDFYTRSTVEGPVFCPCDPTAATRFFPLYPLLVRVLGTVLGGHLLLAGIVVSNLCLLAALVGVALLVRHEFPGSSPVNSLVLVVAYPLGFVLATTYSEALFLALATFCLLFTRRGQWRVAAGLAFLAALTRPSAIVLVPVLAWEFARQVAQSGGWARRRPLLRPRTLFDGALVLLAVPAGYAVFMAFLGARFGSPLVGARAHELFNNQHLTPFWQTVIAMVSGIDRVSPEWQAMRAVDLGAAIAVLVISITWIARAPVAFSLYSIGLVVLHLSLPNLGFFGGDILASDARYMTAAVPVFVLLGARLDTRAWATLLVSAGFLLQAALLVRYFAGGYVA